MRGSKSSTCFPESAGSRSASNGPECEPSPSVKLIRSAGESCASTGQAFQSTKISEPSQEPDCQQTELFPMSSAGGSRVRTFRQQVTAPASRARGPVFGPNTPGSFARFDRATSSWKTAQRSFSGDLDEFSETWPRSGLVASGTAFELQPLEHHSKATESTFLPRPTRSMGKRGWGFARPSSTPGRYSSRVLNIALQFGWRPPVDLLEWAMGFPITWTDVSEPKYSATPSSRKSPNSSAAPSSPHTNEPS